MSREDRIPGGLADKANPKDFDREQLLKGVKVELEHTNDPEVALEIAMDHLMEDPKYYDKLATIEKHYESFSLGRIFKNILLNNK